MTKYIFEAFDRISELRPLGEICSTSSGLHVRKEGQNITMKKAALYGSGLVRLEDCAISNEAGVVCINSRGKKVLDPIKNGSFRVMTNCFSGREPFALGQVVKINGIAYKYDTKRRDYLYFRRLD